MNTPKAVPIVVVVALIIAGIKAIAELIMAVKTKPSSPTKNDPPHAEVPPHKRRDEHDEQRW